VLKVEDIPQKCSHIDLKGNIFLYMHLIYLSRSAKVSHTSGYVNKSLSVSHHIGKKGALWMALKTIPLYTLCTEAGYNYYI
jgi:hypothetical protein